MKLDKTSLNSTRVNIKLDKTSLNFTQSEHETR